MPNSANAAHMMAEPAREYGGAVFAQAGQRQAPTAPALRKALPQLVQTGRRNAVLAPAVGFQDGGNRTRGARRSDGLGPAVPGVLLDDSLQLASGRELGLLDADL